MRSLIGYIIQEAVGVFICASWLRGGCEGEMFSIVVSCFVACSKTLQIAVELGDRALEAQACYSLGNTYTLMRDYEHAIEYHVRHLRIAQVCYIALFNIYSSLLLYWPCFSVFRGPVL